MAAIPDENRHSRRQTASVVSQTPVPTPFDSAEPSTSTNARYLKAAALHDELLKAGIDCITAAAAFNQALVADGVGKLERFKMTAAVAFYKFA